MSKLSECVECKCEMQEFERQRGITSIWICPSCLNVVKNPILVYMYGF